MHNPSNEDRAKFARSFANRLNVSVRTIRKARQGSVSALAKVNGANVGATVAMADHANIISKGKKKGYKIR